MSAFQTPQREMYAHASKIDREIKNIQVYQSPSYTDLNMQPRLPYTASRGLSSKR